jgi:MFS family permease
MSATPPLATRLTMLLVASLTVMSGATIAPALPTMAEHFAAAPDAAFWTRLVLAGPALSIALTASLGGRLIDRVGRLRPLFAALALYALAGSAGLWLDTLPALVASRIVLGLAVAVLMTTASTLVGDYMQGPARDRFMGHQAAFMGYGGVVFLSLGGVLAAAQWRAPFAVYLVSLVVLPLAWRTLWEPSRHASPRPEETAAAPPRHRLPVPAFHAMAALTFVTFYQVPTLLPFLLEDLGTPAPEAAGLVVATMNLFAATTSLAYGCIRARYSHPAIAAGGFGFLAGGFVVIALAPTTAVVGAGTAVAGIGLGLSMPNTAIWLMTSVPAARRGRAMGGQTGGVFLGQVAAPLLAQPLVAAWGPAAAYWGAVALLVPAAAAFALWARRR